MSWNIKTPGDYINGPLTVAGNATLNGTLTVTGAGPHSVAGQLASTGGTAGFQMQPRDGSGANWLLYNPTGDDFRVYNNVGNDVVIVNNIGNFGVGVVPKTWFSSRRALSVGSATSLVGYVGSPGSELWTNCYLDASATARSIFGGYESTFFYSAGGAFVWQTAPSVPNANDAVALTTKMTLDNVGNLIVVGNIVPPAGKGINFSDTAEAAGRTSELFNDYEEGTFTPAITFGGANVGMAGIFNGRYTKVGRAVTINGIIALSAKGSSTGIAKISGLPFTSANASGEYTAISIRLDRVSFADYPCGYVGPNSSVVELENTTNAGTVSSMTDSNFINTSVVLVNFTYTV